MSAISLKTVTDICDQLHICLIKAINTAMTEKAGDNWFDTFREFDKNNVKPILDSEHTSVNRMDLQACLKFFRFRGDYAGVVFEHFGYNFFGKSEDAQKAQRMLYQLLDNIIHNVRNHLYAHANATMVQDGSDDSLRYAVYGPREAVNDMLRLAEFFSAVTDDDGVSIYSKMIAMSNPSDNYSVSEVIAKEGINLSVGDFVEVCNKLGIPVVSGKGGEMFFSSANYDGDIAKIKLHVSQNFREMLSYAISDVIAAEGLEVAIGDFVEACQRAGVTVSTNAAGILVMSTDNYSGDIAKVKLCLNAPKPAKKNTGLIIGIAVAAVALIALLIAVITGMSGDDTPVHAVTGSFAHSQSDSVPADTKADSAVPEESETPATSIPEDTAPATEKPADTTAAVKMIYGEEKFGTLTFTVDQGHDNSITVKLSNGNIKYKLGWATDPTITLETVSGKKMSPASVVYNNPMRYVNPNSSSDIYLFFDSFDEDIKSITFTDIVTLNGTGLPTSNNYATVVIDITNK